MDPQKPISLNTPTQALKPVVLVIDDNPQYAILFDLLSENLGITVRIVTSCDEAIHVIDKFAFDIILMDWLMPEIDGPACTTKIRQIEKETGRHTPIIGVSGYIRATREKCIAAGMDDFLAVPFTLEQLQDKLREWLHEKPQ